jgi:DNA helicase-2/ATP-dependent DNA helicase PcrA
MSSIRNNEIKDLSFLNDLSEEQKRAVIYNDSPQLVLSGPGSGKTKVLACKIAYLIKTLDIPPYNI